MYIICPNCGELLDENEFICPTCGCGVDEDFDEYDYDYVGP